MIKIAVCDDEADIRNKLSEIIKKFFEIISRPVWVAEYKSGFELLKANIRFDIVFLDIEMPDLNGIETALKLRKWDVNSKIIYVTNFGNYKTRAYKVHAFDYISKPIKIQAIDAVLNEAIRYLDCALEKVQYAFKTDEGVVTLELDDIFYFEYLSRKVIIHSVRGRYTAVYTLKELLKKFQKHNFALTHKSFIINMFHIKRIKGFEILMENGETVPLAQKRAVEFKLEFNDYLQSTFDKI